MRLATLFGPDFHRTLESEPEAIREALEELHEEDIAEICEELSEADVIRLLTALPDEFAAGVLERLPDERRTGIVERVEATKAARLLAGMAPDDLGGGVPAAAVDHEHLGAGAVAREIGKEPGEIRRFVESGHHDAEAPHRLAPPGPRAIAS